MRERVVVDTNVPIVANGRAAQASPECVTACIERLREIRGGGAVLLDDGGRILEEYSRGLSRSGYPGAGDAFFKWVWDRQGVVDRCVRVRVTPHPGRVFAEFPEAADLRDFDRDDRVFVAVAKSSRPVPPILNASDTDWWAHRDALRREGVEVEFICPELMEPV